MKVLFVTTESLIDHSYTMIDELKKHIDVCTIITAKSKNEEIKSFCRKHNAFYFKRARFANPLRIIGEMKLLRFVKRQKADCVWFNTLSFLQSVLIKFFIRGKLVINAHDVELHPGESDYHGMLSQKITFNLFKKSVAVMSKTQAAVFAERYKHYPYVLQLPVINYYEKCSVREASAGKKYEGNNSGKKVKFFFFGSILVYKGIETLIEAARMLESETDDFVVNIYGKIMYNNQQILESINHVKSINLYDNYIDYKEVYGIFKSNDVIIIPYRHVSQCGPLLIAYNQNKPVICSRLPGFEEYVEEGKSGFFFDNTSKGLAEKMKEVINKREEINNMSGYISDEMMRKFSMASLAVSYIECFKRAGLQA
jgi:glycosyltransferase involved in cell wall biosynthesis